MNIQLILIHAALFMFLFPPGITEKPATDTLRIKTEGTGNHIRVDSAWFYGSPADTMIAAGVAGEIIQTGQNNQVEINTSRKVGENRKSRHFVGAPSNKKQILNNNQKTNCKNQTKPAIRRQADRQTTSNEKPVTCNMKRVTISQSGNNNSVKINQR